MSDNIFLSAEWNNLLMLNYAVDPMLLQPHVPAGTELDFFNGQTYLSLIGFEFEHTRLLGLPVPFHQHFSEVNIRFYVRRGARRGAVFISELVPKFAVAAIARMAFNENYSRVPISHRLDFDSNGNPTNAEYHWGVRSNRCSMWMRIDGPSFLPPDNSASQFITEHYWGYAAQRDGGCKEYEVKHPQWRIWNAERAIFTGNAIGFYGAKFAEVLTHDPDSAFLAKGSPVTVSKGIRWV